MFILSLVHLFLRSEYSAPCLYDLQGGWQYGVDGVPLLWTVLTPGGEINFFSFTDVDLPAPI